VSRRVDYTDCRRALMWLYDYLDGEAPSRQAQYVERHLELCSHCLEQFDFESEMLKLIRQRASKGKAPTSFRKRVLKMLRQA
jgi:anti-sigma factor (TIGR02949 family)